MHLQEQITAMGLQAPAENTLSNITVVTESGS